MKILVVDDNPDILDAVELVMITEGHQANTLLNAKKVFEEVDSFNPDLIILDYLLSGSDGREICKKLKNAEKTAAIPVIMISAHPSVEDSVKDFGADAFLSKPFSVDELISTIQEHASG